MRDDGGNQGFGEENDDMDRDPGCLVLVNVAWPGNHWVGLLDSRFSGVMGAEARMTA
jgi:hypothetical protein